MIAMIMKILSMKNIDNSALNTSELIHQIIYFLKHKKDYSKAAQIMKSNFITLDLIQESNNNLTQSEIDELQTILASK